ncbi:MAG: 16S rRNA (cytidine1402-2'-O)-methyltransferase [Thermoproteota archaeon]|jgi:16S rRNA (cytidine1402-2'-O)-methyltransferase
MGKLIQVTLPIGNNKDITTRSLEAIKYGEYFFVEDTRVFKKYLDQYGISFSGKKIDSFHDHSGDKKAQRILKVLETNDVYLCSDAGSPYVSDPAFPIVRLAIENGIELDSYSGISSPIVALELSALAPIPFHFNGFLPRDKGGRVKSYEHCLLSTGTHIFFEGVSRIEQSLQDLANTLPDHKVVVARELTKEYQSIYRFKASEWKEQDIVTKGEFIILVENSESSVAIDGEVKKLAQQILENGAKPKLIAKLLSELTGESSRDIYQKFNKKE